MSSAAASGARVVVVVKPGCHLCETAVGVVADVCGAAGVGWAEQQLADLPEPDQRRWAELIPVVLVDGAVHDALRVDPRRLAAALGV